MSALLQKLFARLKGLKKSALVKNFFVLVGGSTFAQLIGLILSPVLSRMYSPEHFGVLGSIMAVVGVMSLIGSLKYDMAIVIENDDEKVSHLQKLNILVISAMTLLTAIGIYVFIYWIPQGASENFQYLPWALPIIFFSALYNVYYARFNREQEYKSMAISQIVRRLSIIGVQIIWGLFAVSELGLIMGNIIGVIVPVIVMILIKRNYFSFNLTSWSNLREVAVRYIDFPKYTTPQSLLNLVSGQLPIFVLGYYYDLATVGAFYFALKIVQMPAMFIGLSVRQIFFKECAKIATNIPAVRKLFNRFTLVLVGGLMLPMIGMFFFAEDIFIVVFGKEWGYAGLLGAWMFILFGTNIIAGPARSLFISLNQQRMVFGFDIALFIVKTVCLVLIPLYFNALIAVAALSLITALSNIVSIIFWNRRLGKVTNE